MRGVEKKKKGQGMEWFAFYADPALPHIRG